MQTQGKPDGQGTGAGTLRYLAPEALRGQIDKASDVYAYSMTIYEVCAFHTFPRTSVSKCSRQIFTNTPPFLHVPDAAICHHIVVERTRLTRPTSLDVINRGLNDGLWDLVWNCSEFLTSDRPEFGIITKATERLVEERQCVVAEGKVQIEGGIEGDILDLIDLDLEDATTYNTVEMATMHQATCATIRNWPALLPQPQQDVAQPSTRDKLEAGGGLLTGRDSSIDPAGTVDSANYLRNAAILPAEPPSPPPPPPPYTLHSGHGKQVWPSPGAPLEKAAGVIPDSYPQSKTLKTPSAGLPDRTAVILGSYAQLKASRALATGVPDRGTEQVQPSTIPGSLARSNALRAPLAYFPDRGTGKMLPSSQNFPTTSPILVAREPTDLWPASRRPADVHWPTAPPSWTKDPPFESVSKMSDQNDTIPEYSEGETRVAWPLAEKSSGLFRSSTHAKEGRPGSAPPEVRAQGMTHGRLYE